MAGGGCPRDPKASARTALEGERLLAGLHQPGERLVAHVNLPGTLGHEKPTPLNTLQLPGKPLCDEEFQPTACPPVPGSRLDAVNLYRFFVALIFFRISLSNLPRDIVFPRLTDSSPSRTASAVSARSSSPSIRR